MQAVTERLARHVVETDHDGLPGEVLQRTAALILDAVGILIRARHDAESTACLLQTAVDLGWSDGKIAVPGDAAGYTPSGAALLNGALIHSLDFDDTHAQGSIHPGAPVIGAALASAQMVGAGGREVIAAVSVGYDVACRLSEALVPADHYARGFHPTATAGTFGAAAAAAKLLNLSADRTAAAFGLCGSLAAGSLQFLENGGWNKRYQVGAAAANGLAAAVASRAGFLGAALPIEGSRGFLQGYAPNPRPEAAIDGLGTRHAIMETAVKPYPSCRFTHAPLDGLLAILTETGWSHSEIDSIEIGLSDTGLALVGLPEAQKRQPVGVVDGQFSMHFIAAAGTVYRGFAWDDYARGLEDPDVRALMDRVQVVPDAEVQKAYPAQLSGAVTVTARGGSRRRFVHVPFGEPENFLSDEQLQAKFLGLVAPVLGQARAETLAARLTGLSAEAELGSLIGAARPETDQVRLRTRA
jgi:2-methylcitrate dehydratase PrpD